MIVKHSNGSPVTVMGFGACTCGLFFIAHTEVRVSLIKSVWVLGILMFSVITARELKRDSLLS